MPVTTRCMPSTEQLSSTRRGSFQRRPTVLLCPNKVRATRCLSPILPPNSTARTRPPTCKFCCTNPRPRLTRHHRNLGESHSHGCCKSLSLAFSRVSTRRNRCAALKQAPFESQKRATPLHGPPPRVEGARLSKTSLAEVHVLLVGRLHNATVRESSSRMATTSTSACLFSYTP